MKELSKSSRTIGYLEKMFRVLNEQYFNGELEEPIITLQSTPRAHGHVTVGKAWVAGQTRRHELNIGAGTVGRPIEEVTATLLHEMVHIWNIQKNTQDCSRGGTYHNKRFKEEAEKRDLDIKHHEKYGWTITTATEKLLDFIIDMQWTDILINRDECGKSGVGKGGSKTPTGTSGEGKKKSSTRKYACPCCGQSIRATKEVRMLCMDCNKQLQEI